jgi:hypothetical protein
MSDQVIKAKPTIFNGKQYKSRLEATFAEWLTDKGAAFEYEPCCLGPERYVPDFAVYDDRDQIAEFPRVLVEVKPICFHTEAWIAIRAAQECGDWLMVVDSPERREFGCYAVVWQGELAFFTRSKGMIARLVFNNGRGLRYNPNGPFH